MPEMIANLDDAKIRSKIANRINQLRGMYRIDVRKYRPRRSDRQNRYYWPCLVQPFAEFLREQGEPVTDLEAHDLLKSKFLRRTIEVGGDRLDVVGSSAELDTAAFNAYLDAAAAWLADMFGIVVPDPADYHEQ